MKNHDYPDTAVVRMSLRSGTACLNNAHSCQPHGPRGRGRDGVDCCAWLNQPMPPAQRRESL
jgi:hypothetical protein